MRIAIVGGGAAGMMCAATIAETNPRADVFLIEKNPELAKKVLISGGGRCNVTTGYDDVAMVLKKYPRGDKFLQSSMHAFSPDMVRAWFEQHGVPLKCEDDWRVFPVSDNGEDVVGAFTKVFAASKVKVLTGHHVKGITKEGNTFAVTFKEQEPLKVDRVVLALGGQAYRQTGSTGDGYTLAEALGHTITPLAPSLNSFITIEKWPKSISGMSFISATITAKRAKKYEFTGPFLFTHTGVSGPAVFALSSLIAFEDYGQKKPLAITIDVLPDMTTEEVEKKIKQTLHENPKKQFKNSVHLIPASLVERLCQEVHIAPEKKNGEISNQEITAAVTWMKNIPLQVNGRGAGDEFVTAGGVALPEIDPRTMESKKCSGLYFAGEILNVDGFTGGFNLQASWAMGRAAGLAIAER